MSRLSEPSARQIKTDYNNLSTYKTNLLTQDPNTVHNPSVNVKFAQPRTTTENVFPESGTSLQETLQDLVSLKDNTSLYARTREKYIEDKLNVII